MRHQSIDVYRRLAVALLVAALLGAGAVLAQTGGGYDLSWSTVDAGRSSAGGSYQLSAAIGQPDPGSTLSGGVYSLNGGFLSGASLGNKLYLPLLRR